MPPHHPGQSLGPGGGVSAPKGSLRAGSVFFAGLLQPFVFFIMMALGSWWPVLNLSNLCARYIILKEVYLLFPMHPYSGVSSVHGVWQSFPILGSLLGSLHGSTGLHAFHGSGSEFSPQSWIRLRPYLHDWLLQASSRELIFFL